MGAWNTTGSRSESHGCLDPSRIKELKRLSACRHFLQVVTIADLCDATGGRFITSNIFKGNRHTDRWTENITGSLGIMAENTGPDNKYPYWETSYSTWGIGCQDRRKAAYTESTHKQGHTLRTFQVNIKLHCVVAPITVVSCHHFFLNCNNLGNLRSSSGNPFEGR